MVFIQMHYHPGHFDLRVPCVITVGFGNKGALIKSRERFRLQANNTLRLKPMLRFSLLSQTIIYQYCESVKTNRSVVMKRGCCKIKFVSCFKRYYS